MPETAPKTAQLTPEEWKQLCILNAAQLQNFLQSIPGNTETGASGLTDEAMSIVDMHMARGRTFLGAWARAKFEMPKVAQPAAQHHGNGAEKRKGGWPLGKKRARRVQQDQTQ